MLEATNILKIVRLPDGVFKEAIVETIILIFEKKGERASGKKTEIVIYDKSDKLDVIDYKMAKKHFQVNQKVWEKNKDCVFNIFSNQETMELLDKIEKDTSDLINVCDFSLGITPYDKHKGHSEDQIENKVFHSPFKKDKTFVKLLDGGDVIRYGVFWNGKKWLKYDDWLGAPREQRFFSEDHIVVRQIVSGKPLRIYAAYCEGGLYNTQIGFNILIKKDKNVRLKYILALLNSKLMNFYHSEKFLDKSKDIMQKILIQNAKTFPIRIADEKDEEKIIRLVDGLTSLVESLHELGKKKTSRREGICEKISQIEKDIDYLIYDIYGLKKKEIDIIEESFKA